MKNIFRISSTIGTAFAQAMKVVSAVCVVLLKVVKWVRGGPLHWDWLALLWGGVTLVMALLGFGGDWLEWFVGIAASMAVLYMLYAIYLFWRRPEFDWHLINGHFLRKVCCLIILMPLLFTAIAGCFIDSPKELIYDDNLYECGSVGLPCDIKQQQKNPNMFWGVYFHFIDAGNQHMATTGRGRAWSALVAVMGMFLLNGLLVSSIIGWVDRRKEEWMNGNVRYRRRHLGKYRYAVVIGANEIAASVLRNLFTPKKRGVINYKCEGRNRYVILQTSRDVNEVRSELASHLGKEDLKKVIIYRALRDSKEEMAHLFVGYSTEIYVLGESTLIDGGDTYHDSMNMRCVNVMVDELEKSYKRRCAWKRFSGYSAKKLCKVMFEYQTTSSIFQFTDIPERIKTQLVFIPFNRYEAWARAVISDNVASKECNEMAGKLRYTPLDGDDSITEDENSHVHFVVVGMSKMGVAMGLQAMMQAHCVNYAKAEMEMNNAIRRELKRARTTRITFIDTNADKEMAFFKGRYENLFSLMRHRYVDANKCNMSRLQREQDFKWIDPMEKSGGKWSHLSSGGENFIDLEIEFIKGELESEGVRGYLRGISDKENEWVKNSKLTIAVCLTCTHQAVAASLYMPVSVYEKAQEIWVYQRESADIVLTLTNSTQKDKRYKRLKPFGMLYGGYMSDRGQYLKSLLVNGAYDLNRREGETVVLKAEDRNLLKKETYSDLRRQWKALSIDKKFSNRYFVDSISQKIRMLKAVGLDYDALKSCIDANADVLARCEHNRWNVQQLLMGYSPCDKDTDSEFRRLNDEYANAYAAFKAWSKTVGWEKLSKEKQAMLMMSEECCIALNRAKEAFKSTKEGCKECEDRVHPNICSFDHLDYVDFGAKSYDIYLNSVIPTIKLLVDDRERKDCSC